jgi:hypothetical protein
VLRKPLKKKRARMKAPVMTTTPMKRPSTLLMVENLLE